MKLNFRFTYPAVNRVTSQEGTRYYVCPETGEHLSSVTTILSATSDKTQLLEWRKRVGDEKADLIRDQALGLGTLMHTHLENHILGLERPGGNNVVRVQASHMADVIIQNGLCHVDEVWGCEVALTFPGLFAGTTDIVGVYKGRPAIMDFKTAKKMRKSSEIEDYRLQIAAYIAAHNLHYGTDIDQGVIFMVDRAFKFQAFEMNREDVETATAQWCERLDEFYGTGSKAAAIEPCHADILLEMAIMPITGSSDPTA